MSPDNFTRPDVVRELARRSDVSDTDLLRAICREDLPVEAREAAGFALRIRERGEE